MLNAPGFPGIKGPQMKLEEIALQIYLAALQGGQSMPFTLAFTLAHEFLETKLDWKNGPPKK